MSAWHKDTWQGQPVIYMGDGKNSVVFSGPQAEFYRDEYFDALAHKDREQELDVFCALNGITRGGGYVSL